MSHRKRFVIAFTGAMLSALLVFLLLAPRAAPPGKPVAWRIQPDRFPLGAALQGSRVEMSLGVFSGIKPTPLPGFLSGLPSPLKSASEWTFEQFRTLSARQSLRLAVEAPAFVKVERARVELHSTQGPFALVHLRLKTDTPGDWQGNLIVHLKGAAFGVTNINVPVSVKILGVPASAPRAVLIAETPYECYATEDGRHFEPLAALSGRLAQEKVRIDFLHKLPATLSGYRTILLAGSEMAQLGPAQTARLEKFVADGGRLILAANAFFASTAPNANNLLKNLGLHIVNQDAGLSITNSKVVVDSLTVGVNGVVFWRPSRIDVTDPAQGKLLVEAGDDHGGYVAVSRQKSRGEVIVLTQSLWWNWIRSDPTPTDNSLLLENLLAH